jgi:hypothetical protein
VDIERFCSNFASVKIGPTPGEIGFPTMYIEKKLSEMTKVRGQLFGMKYCEVDLSKFVQIMALGSNKPCPGGIYFHYKNN